jgi:hypothetical protein
VSSPLAGGRRGRGIQGKRRGKCGKNCFFSLRDRKEGWGKELREGLLIEVSKDGWYTYDAKCGARICKR